MARLFGKEFHEHSNSWYFKSIITSFEKGDLSFRKYLDENGNVVFKFEASDKENKLFIPKVEIVYNKINREILSHYCSEDGQEICRHYLSILNYAYKYYSTGILDTDVIQTYQARLLEYNEYWQRIVLNAKIEIGDIFNEKNNKIRFYFRNYAPMNIRLISILSADKEYKEEDESDIELARKQAKSLSESELELLILLQNQKCSFSRKGFFFTVYKSKFIKFFPILRSLSHKIFIKETGDKIKFPDEEFRINFQVNKYKDDLYKLEVSAGEQISATFVGRTTYFFKQNMIYSLNLPFNQKITKQVFSEGYIIKKTDLVYLSSIVARQLGLIKCYIDFAEDIEFPEVYHNTPVITFNLHKEKNKIVMKGLLDYSQGLTIPMSVIRFSTELVRYDQDEEISWFYIPPQTKYQIFDFVQKLPDSQTQRLEEKSQLVFEGEENIEALKKIIFEQASPEWNIILSEELKKEFVYKVNLQPLIRAKKTHQINWFEYEIEYKFKDISFTHQELKKFFNTKEKFLKLDDGRLLFFENKIAFQKVDDLLKKSEKSSSNAYRLYVYNIPYVYQLSSIQLGIKISGDNYLEEMFSSILKRKLRKKTPVPKFLQPVMRTYQKKGFHWLKMLQHYGLSGILADDMGLGKTIQAISILSDLPSNALSIVICPKTLLFNWAVEIEKFNRNLSFIIYEGNQKERRNILDNLNVDVILASYSIIQNDIEYLSEIDFEYIILDEAQHIKNAEALRTQAVKKLQSKHRMVLSGTPIENNPSELWSIFDFLMPGYLPSLRRFKNEFMVSSDVNKETQAKLKALISPFILRRKKKDVLIELPDKQEQISYCKMIPLQEKMYLQVIEKVKKNILIKFDDSGQNFIHVLAALMRLRQICDHPYLINKNIHQRVEFSGKTELLKEIIVDAVENDKKILIFSQFVKMLQILRKMLKELKIAFEYMDGSTKNRQKVIDNFNNNNSIRAFLISLKTGGFGVNLTAADTVIIVDPWWNPMGETQAVDRAHRIGQTKKVMVYKIITKGSIEEKILDLQQNKREMFENLIEEGQSVFKNLTSEQLRNLFEY